MFSEQTRMATIQQPYARARQELGGMVGENETVKTVDAACQADRQWPRHLRTRALPGRGGQGRDDGVASFDLIRHWHHADGAFLFAFDLIELNGDDLRRDPLVVRKATLASVLARAAP